MIRLLIAFLFYFSLAHADETGCANDAVVNNADYLAECETPNACVCSVGAPVIKLFHMSDPLSNRHSVAQCSMGEQAVNLITNVNDQNRAAAIAGPCPPELLRSDYAPWLEEQLRSFAPECGYNLRTSARQINATLRLALSMGPRATCASSMCTSASYTAFALLMQRLQTQNRLPGGASQLAELTSGTQSSVWKYFNELARPDLAMQGLGIGDGRLMKEDEIQSCAARGWPRSGDFVQLWRKNSSGHSVVFAGYLKNSEGVITGLCYWSSNQETNGFAHRCEAIEKFEKVIAGRVTQ